MKTIKKAANLFKYICCLACYCFSKLLALFLKNKPEYKDLWLLSERKTDARDNAYHFFRYLNKYHPEINCAYVIDKNSPDFEKVKDLGRIIQPGTIRHRISFAAAKALISTHLMGPAPDTYRFAILDRKFGVVKNKKIIIRHGIACSKLTELTYPNARVDMLVCSTEAEYRAMQGYGHPEGVIKRLGLCRYDNLFSPHEVLRRILIMPTWRYFLRTLSDEEFKNSQYYKNFSALINNEKLLKTLRENDFEVLLYLHYELQPYSHLFESKSDRVKIMTMGTADVQQLLMEASILVTDYSSVHFDFAYMDKPVIYWQFDEEKFYATQYEKGYFESRRDGFGPVFDTDDAEPLADYTEKLINNNSKVFPEYEERIKNCFTEQTSDHCEKTFEAIKNILDRA